MQNNSENNKKLYSIIDQIIQQLPFQAYDFKKLFKDLKDQIANNSANKETVISICKQYLSVISTQQKAVPNITNLKRNWKCLWLEDEPNDKHSKLENILKNKYNITCIRKKNYEEIREELQKDWQRKEYWKKEGINVFLTDFRLYTFENEEKKWQKKQGYKIIQELNLTERPIATGILSGLSTEFLLYTQKHFNIKTELFPKELYFKDDNSLNLLAYQIAKMGDLVEEAQEELPQNAGGWKNLHEYYLAFKNDPNFELDEKMIIDAANQIIAQYKRENNFNFLVAGIGKPINSKFSPVGGINNLEWEKTKDKLKLYLTMRRVVIYLSQIERKKNIEIFELFFPESLEKIKNKTINSEEKKNNEKKAISNSATQFINNNLGLRLEDFPMGITPEEKKWLHNNCDFPIYKDLSKSQSIFSDIAKIFKDNIKKSEEMSIFDSYKIELGSDIFYKIPLKIDNGDYYYVILENDYKPNFKFSAQIKAFIRFIKDKQENIYNIFVSNVCTQLIHFYDISKNNTNSSNRDSSKKSINIDCIKQLLAFINELNFKRNQSIEKEAGWEKEKKLFNNIIQRTINLKELPEEELIICANLLIAHADCLDASKNCNDFDNILPYYKKIISQNKIEVDQSPKLVSYDNEESPLKYIITNHAFEDLALDEEKIDENMLDIDELE